MVTTGQLRVLVTEFIRKITREEIVGTTDIRWLKSGNGVFPRKYVWAGEVNNSEFKETPYSPEDTFILFDILQSKNIASERIGDLVKSQLPFKLIINIYGQGCEDEVQYMLASLHTYATRLWLSSNNVSLKWEPDEFQILDGRENASWWLRRRIELELNTQQELDYNSGIVDGDDIDVIARHIDFVNEGS